jgi:hypothetical protein
MMFKVYAIALSIYAPRLDSKVATFVQQVRQQLTTTQFIDIAEWCGLFAYDVMGDIGLGRDFRSLEAGKAHTGAEFIRKTMTLFSSLGSFPWFLQLMGYLPRHPSEGFAALTNYSTEQVRQKEEVCMSTLHHSQRLKCLL